MKLSQKHEKYFYPGVGVCSQYQDLPWYLNEMLQEIADEKDRDMIVQNINTYYNSLNTLLIEHTTEHPGMSKS